MWKINKYDKTRTNEQNHNSPKQVNNNNISDLDKCQKLCLLCHATPGVTTDIHALLPSVVHSVLPNHYQITKEHGPMGRLPLLTH